MTLWNDPEICVPGKGVEQGGGVGGVGEGGAVAGLLKLEGFGAEGGAEDVLQARQGVKVVCTCCGLQLESARAFVLLLSGLP